MKRCYAVLSMVLCCFLASAQSGSRSKLFHIDNKVVINARSSATDPDPRIENRVLPKPHPGTDRAAAEAVRQQLNRYRQSGRSNASLNRSQNADPPLMMRNFVGNSFNGFVPNDNDVAISNGDQVCSVTNTTIWSKDQFNNMTYGSFNLHTLTTSLGLQQEEFDPKVLYDPVANRFIMVCLNGFTDSTSNILVGFSQDTTSHNNWNFYALPGDPLGNNLWTDFPMIAVTTDELFITVNLLYNDSSWQAGFNETVIWQINKNEGYSGTALNPLLHHNIFHNNEPLRNLCPVKGGSTVYGPNQYFISNRNFTAANDTVFLVEVSGAINVPPPVVTVTPLVTGLEYRMPVNALQPSLDSLIVNDARVLGAFHENDKVQFVFNTLDTVSGQVCIYHGVIDISGTPAVTASLYINDTLDLAYPNIAYAGTGPADNTSVVSVLYSASTLFPGTAAFKYDGNGVYSPLTTVKTGVSYVNMLVGNERWGDYTGCQTRYNIPGHVWINGSYSQSNHTTRTWIAELTVTSGVGVPESSIPEQPVMLYPNPGEDRIMLEFNKLSDGPVHIGVYDMQGRMVKKLYQGSISGGENSFSFNILSMNAGQYMLTIHDTDGTIIASRKFIKK